MFKAYAAQKAKGDLAPFEYDPKPLTPWEVEVEISHCGLCHSDLHLLNNDWGMTTYPFVPGHEIIGHVTKQGDLSQLKDNQRVGIGWQRSSCSSCEWCHRGEQNLCSTQEATCVHHHGGFAEKIRIDSRFAFPIPDALDSVSAAPLLCGGATVFSPLLTHNVTPLTRIGVIGIGGLGHIALQFANAFGTEVFAFSSTPSKEAEAKQFGAHHFSTTADSKFDNTIDLLLCTTSSAIDWPSYLRLLRPAGTFCHLGAPVNGNSTLQPHDLIGKRLNVAGSNIASPAHINEMLRFAANHNIAPKTELFQMHEINEVLKKLAANQIHYRAVLKWNYS